MTLRDVQIEPLRLRLRHPLVTARGTWDVRAGAVIALGDGVRWGWGEATPLEFGPSAAAHAIEALVHAGDTLRGRALPETTEAIDSLIDGIDALAQAPAARHAVESALLDLLAQTRGISVAGLLAPSQPRDQVEVNALLGATEPEALAEEGRQAAEAGFRVFKVKVGAGPIERDAVRLEALRAALGPSARIRIDANGAWAPERASRNLEVLCRYGLELCEQPVPAEAIDALGGLRGAVGCRIAADESAFTVDQARALYAGAVPRVDVLVLRPMVLGGALRTLAIAREAAAQGVGSYVASSLDGAVARALSVHLAAALPNADWACGLGVGGLFVDLDEGPYAPVQGRIALPKSSGLGLAGRSA